MKILLASDMHGSNLAVKTVHDAVKKISPDLFVVCGDITNFGPTSFAREFLKSVSVKTFAIPGNCDPPELVKDLEELGMNIHEKKVEFGGSVFVGFGGSSLTPFDTYLEFSEEEIVKLLRPLMEPDAVLVSHSPPYGFCDLTRSGEHVGSRALREIVEKFRPKLVMTGHIHEARGVVKGPTTIVNPGMAANGHLAIVDLNKNVEVELI